MTLRERDFSGKIRLELELSEPDLFFLLAGQELQAWNKTPLERSYDVIIRKEEKKGGEE